MSDFELEINNPKNYRIIYPGPRLHIFLSSDMGSLIQETIKGKVSIEASEIALRESGSKKVETLTPTRSNIFGGIKAPHVHYAGETYLLSDKQWNVFSQKVINGFQNKLAHAKGISFDQLTDLSEVMSGIVSDE